MGKLYTSKKEVKRAKDAQAGYNRIVKVTGGWKLKRTKIKRNKKSNTKKK